MLANFNVLRIFLLFTALCMAQDKASPGVGKKGKAGGERAVVAQAQDALKNKDWNKAEGLFEKLINEHPKMWQYRKSLGDAQFGLGKYEDAIASYSKGVDLVKALGAATDTAVSKARNVAVGQMLTSEGNAYLKLRKYGEAIDLFTRAAAIDPNPGIAYFNLCATMYNTGNVERAIDVCEKAIEADPGKADAYFIKGSLLIAGSTVGKDGRMVAPPGTVEALQKYLELAPSGSHASDVKSMLSAIGAKIETTYQGRKKKRTEDKKD